MASRGVYQARSVASRGIRFVVRYRRSIGAPRAASVTPACRSDVRFQGVRSRLFIPRALRANSRK
jgi:hypothetical protein